MIYLKPPHLRFLYLYAPILLSQYLSLNIYTLFQLYIFLMVCFIAYLCREQLIKINGKNTTHFTLIATLLVVFLILPGNSLGQKDYFSLLLGLPYLFLVAAKTQSIKTNTSNDIIIGLLAALGFSIKPYFIVIPLIIEIYLILKHKNIFFWLRTETITLVIMLFILLLLIVITAPEYFTQMVPFGIIYSKDRYVPWSIILLQPPALFCYLSLIYAFILKNKLKNKTLIIILSLGTLGFLITYLIQKRIWSYHLLPAFSLAIIIVILMLSELIDQFYYLLNKKTNEQMFNIIILSIMLLLPLFIINQSFRSQAIKYYQADLTQLNMLIKKYSPHQTIYVFDSDSLTNILLQYTRATYRPRLPMNCMLATILREIQLTHSPNTKEKLLNKKQALTQYMIHDFQDNKAKLVFVDTRRFKPFHEGLPNFSYISFLSRDQKFKQIWKRYHFLTNYKDHAVYIKMS